MQKSLLILMLLVLIFVGGAVFMRQKKQSSEVSDPVTIVRPEVNQNESYPQHIEAIQGSNEVWYNIPELRIRMRLNTEFAQDLIYSYDPFLPPITLSDFGDDYNKNIQTVKEQHFGRVAFSSRLLLKEVDSRCLEAAKGALGVLERIPRDNDGKFHSEFSFPEDGSISSNSYRDFDASPNQLLSMSEPEGETLAIYNKIDQNTLVFWFRYANHSLCYEKKNGLFNYFETIENGIPRQLKYDLKDYPYQGLGFKTVPDGFKTIELIP